MVYMAMSEKGKGTVRLTAASLQKEKLEKWLKLIVM